MNDCCKTCQGGGGKLAKRGLCGAKQGTNGKRGGRQMHKGNTRQRQVSSRGGEETYSKDAVNAIAGSERRVKVRRGETGGVAHSWSHKDRGLQGTSSTSSA